jgi:hypothetical protein
VKLVKTPKAYLSGGMEFAKNEGADWRFETEAWIRKKLKHAVYNPNRESVRYLSHRFPGGGFRNLKFENIQRFKEIVRDIVDLDSREIAHRTDYVVCYWDESAQRGAGTKGELTIARLLQKPVYMVTGMKEEEIPGWVLGCTTDVFRSFDELKDFLLEKYRKKRS